MQFHDVQDWKKINDFAWILVCMFVIKKWKRIRTNMLGLLGPSGRRRVKRLKEVLRVADLCDVPCCVFHIRRIFI